MKNQSIVASICGDSTAGNSFSHLSRGGKNNRSPQETSSVASGSNTRRHSKDIFTNVLFNERPSSYKPLSKRKQSVDDFEDPDRHFSMDDSKLFKSKSLTDEIKQLKTTNKNKGNLQRINVKDNEINSSATVLDMVSDSTKNINNNNNSARQLQEQPEKNNNNITKTAPLSDERQNKSKFSKPNDVMIDIPKKQTDKKNENTDNPLQSHQRQSRQSSKQQGPGSSTEGEFGVTRQTGSIVLETKEKDYSNHPQSQTKEMLINGDGVLGISKQNNNNNVNSNNTNQHNNNFTQSRMLFNSSAAQSSDLESTYTTTTLKAALRMIKWSIVACVISAVTGLACYSYQSVYLFTFVSSGVFGESYCLLLMALVMQHPFFKITNESARDSFTIPKYAYIGFSFCLSSLYGYFYRFKEVSSSIHLNGFNTLPLAICLSFLIFAICVFQNQPVLYKRLKLNYGLREERELTLSESKAFSRGKTMVRGITQINLPKNLNNFLPDEQGPKIKSIRFFMSMIIILLLMHGLVYYSFNQARIWHSKTKENEGYFYLMGAAFLVLGEILAGIVYKVDSYFQLEFKYELEVVRGVFSSYLFRVIYLIQPNLQKSLILPVIKIAFKFIIFYIYPTHYEIIKNFVRRILSRCFKDPKDAEFKEMQRRLFTKRLGICQFTDFLSLFAFTGVFVCLCLVALSADANAPLDENGNVENTQHYFNENDFKRYTKSQLWYIAAAGLMEFGLEIIATAMITYFLSRNTRFTGLTLNKLIQEVNHFLVEGLAITFLSFAAVTAAFSVLLSNDLISYLDYSLGYL